MFDTSVKQKFSEGTAQQRNSSGKDSSVKNVYVQYSSLVLDTSAKGQVSEGTAQ